MCELAPRSLQIMPWAWISPSCFAGYRLRILRVNDLPMHTTYDGRTFEFQLGVSLYDEAYGTFYGNTVRERFAQGAPKANAAGGPLRKSMHGLGSAALLNLSGPKPWLPV